MKDQSRTQRSSTPNTRTLEGHPWYFGHYLNMARHNAYVIVQHITENLGIEDKDIKEENLQEAEILNFIKGQSQPDVVKGIVGSLIKHFPFLEVQPPDKKSKKDKKEEGKNQQEKKEVEKPEVAPKPAHIGKELAKAFTRLNQLRNITTHYYHQQAKPAVFELEHYQESARRKIIERFPFLSDKDTNHLKLMGKESSRFALSYEEDGAVHYTEKGLAYFICLFLDRKNAFRFLSRLNDFKNAFENEGRATLECFTHYCCRLPRPKLGSSDLTLDMLNELGRCPKPLYHCLSPEDQQKFKVPIETKIETEEEEEDQPGEVELIRHGDRFPYFALRYFDDTKAFNSLRFHVHLGKLRIKEPYPKEIHGEERERLIIRNMRAFGRWEEYDEEKMPADWKTKERGKWVLKPNIEQPSTHYQITGNRIGIKFVNPLDHEAWPELSVYTSSQEEREKRFQPDAILSTYELQNLFFYHHLHRKGWIKESAEVFIINHIKNLRQFIQEVQAGKIEPVAQRDLERRREDDFNERERQNWLKQKKHSRERRELEAQRDKAIEVRKPILESRREKLRRILAPYGLGLKEIPDEVRAHLMGYETPDDKYEALRKLELKVGECRQLLKRLEKEVERRKARDESVSDRILNGQMATYLAGDLIYLKPPDPAAKNLGKPNNDEYRVLQSSIAYFSPNKDKLLEYFRSLGLMGEGIPFTHPFLKEVNPQERSGVMDFYEVYLSSKLKWLKDIQSELKDSKLSQEKFEEQYGYFLEVGRKAIAKKEYQGKPVYLPRGIFNRAIAEALMQNGASLKPEDSLVRCLDQFFDGDTQEFYRFSRQYANEKLKVAVQSGERSVWDILQEDILPKIDLWAKEAEGNEDDFRAKDLKRFYQRTRRNEQRIRYVQSTDRILWLMVQELAAADHLKIDFSKWSLAKVGFSIEEGEGKNILDEEVDMEMALPTNPDKTICDKLPIKRYGDFRRFAKDRRLRNLLKYFPGEEQSIQRVTLEKELDIYDRLRETLFEEVWEFEKHLFEEYKDKLLKLYPDETHINHRKQLGFMEAEVLSEDLQEPSLEQIASLRNKFLHNEIPFDEEESLEWARKMIQQEGLGEYYTEKLINLVRAVYHKLVREITSIKRKHGDSTLA